MTHDPFSMFKNMPTLTRNAIGFDELFDQLSKWTDNIPKIPTYPPYNIKKTGENTYVIEMAVAGFGKQNLEITTENNTLTVTGRIEGMAEDDYLYKGVADRTFTRQFTLADTVEVKNADLINGMLKIWLERFIPEYAKPKKVDINVKNETEIKNPAIEEKKSETVKTSSKRKERVAA